MTITLFERTAASVPTPAADKRTLFVSSVDGLLYFKDETGAVTAVGSAAGLADPGGNGVVVRTASNVTTRRTITGTGGNIAVADGTGVSANPTINLVATAVTPGNYVNATLTIDAYGRVTAAVASLFVAVSFASVLAVDTPLAELPSPIVKTWTLVTYV